jgi:hypothetical protein
VLQLLQHNFFSASGHCSETLTVWAVKGQSEAVYLSFVRILIVRFLVQGLPARHAASSHAQFFPASKDEVNEIAIHNLLFGL